MEGPSVKERIRGRLVRRRFVREALAGPVDLTPLRTRPSPRVWAGLGLVALSYLLGWPAVALLAWLAFRWQEPLLAVVGGPLIYGFSHLLFLAGSWLAGAVYARVLLRWLTRRLVERLGWTGPGAP